LGFDKWIGQNIELKNDNGVEFIKPNELSVTNPETMAFQSSQENTRVIVSTLDGIVFGTTGKHAI
jgi:hypothetical protein